MILEITDDHIASLGDVDLRTLVAILCECELRDKGHSTSAVTWGGHQNAADGGIDVRVNLPVGTNISGYVPKFATGFQVKAQDMPNAAIQTEMAPNGSVLPSIDELSRLGGAYVMISSKGSVSDSSLTDRLEAMKAAVSCLPNAHQFTLDFYDRRRVATWVNQHPGVVVWVRERLGLGLSGWRPFRDWSSSPASIDSPYILDAGIRLVSPTVGNEQGLDVEHALNALRAILAKPKGTVRLVGLSGVGKTRLIQALFDGRIGSDPLPQPKALYTDIADHPDPSPRDMVERLITEKRRVILIVDNCGAELHAKLAATLGASDGLMSLITVEYDINDDIPAGTQTFRLEPSSPELIQKLLEARYPHIAYPSRDVIARFSEGNARVAFALAETAKAGESLAKLSDTQLFERIFHQSKSHSTELIDAAKACALLYSFEGETEDGPESELVPLGKLVGQDSSELYKHVAELLRRRLVQARGKWRAILPHALANRLALRALEDISLKRLEEQIAKGWTERMIRSFSRRIGYLHTHPQAVAIVDGWFASAGRLAQIGKLSSLDEDIFENAAPVDPSRTLQYIEQSAAANADWFYGAGNSNRAALIRVLRSIAYDAQLFERCVSLLARFAIEDRDHGSMDALKSLFSMYLSGTHATAKQRALFASALLIAGDPIRQEIGIELLEQMLRNPYRSVSQSFEFGAWKRDFGLHPTGDQVRDWYIETIDVVGSVERSGKVSAGRVRHLLATHLDDLLRRGFYREVVGTVCDFVSRGGWPEGWVAVLGALKKCKGEGSDPRRQRLATLEEQMRPSDLGNTIRAYALTRNYSSLDIADAEELEEDKPWAARERVLQYCTELGEQLAADAPLFDALVPEIIRAAQSKTFSLGRGVGAGCVSLPDCWLRLKQEFLACPPEQRNGDFLSGFLSAAMKRSEDQGEKLLDEVLADAELHRYYVVWQSEAGINMKAAERMMRAVKIESVPINSFMILASGRLHEGLDDDRFYALAQEMMKRADSENTVADVIGMRLYGVLSEKRPICDQLRAAGRSFLSKVKFGGGHQLNHHVSQIAAVSYDKAVYEPEVRDLCARIVAAIGGSFLGRPEIGKVVGALATQFPIIVLDVFVEGAGQGIGWRCFRDLVEDGKSPLDPIPEEVWAEWAAEKPDVRYELLARVLRFSVAGDEERAAGWAPAALGLIDSAPEPEKVLDVFLRRFGPSHWSGSRAEILATRLPMIEELKTHPNPKVAAWASLNALAFAAELEKERQYELEVSRGRDETFE